MHDSHANGARVGPQHTMTHRITPVPDARRGPPIKRTASWHLGERWAGLFLTHCGLKQGIRRRTVQVGPAATLLAEAAFRLGGNAPIASLKPRRYDGEQRSHTLNGFPMSPELLQWLQSSRHGSTVVVWG